MVTHTRPDYTATLGRLHAAPADAKETARMNGTDAVTAHAATPGGHQEVAADAEAADACGDIETSAWLTAALNRASTEEVPAPTSPLAPEDVVVSRGVPTGDGTTHPVVARADRAPVGAVVVGTGADGKRCWTVTDTDGTPLVYPVPGPDGEPVARRYANRANAVRALLNEHNGLNDPHRWEGAPVHDWTRQTYVYWGKTFTVGETLQGKTLLHGSPHKLDEGTVLLPDCAPVNFSQSDPFVVSLTTEQRLAKAWGRDAAKGQEFYVYEVEPLTPVKAHRYDMRGWRQDPEQGGRTVCKPGEGELILEEGRVGAARIVRRIDLSANTPAPNPAR